MPDEPRTAEPEWLAQYRATHGRAPRVLHVGNIANNAYNNVKLLNRAGLDCDVLSYDYYHMMGTPEWEDADFEGDHRDDFFPAWEQMDLGGFERPEWFAQAPFTACVDYLVARRGGGDAVDDLWAALTEARIRACERGRRPTPWWLVQMRRLAGRGRRLGRGAARRVWYRVQRTVEHGRWILYGTRRRLHRTLFPGRPFRAIPPGADPSRWPESFEDPNAGAYDRWFDGWVERLVERARTAFPNRLDEFSPADFERLRISTRAFRYLFSHYDLVVGYSTDPMLPMTAGVPYVAIEHGTLRDIPFTPDATGRLTSLAYHLAEHVFVTNWDCEENALKLAGPERVSLVNHPFDDSRSQSIERTEERRAELLEQLDGDALVFYPTRHDWVPSTGYADKANDVFLKAFVELRRRGHRLAMVCCEWGANVEQSKRLLAEAGVDRHVHWVKPLAIIPFQRLTLAADLVVDQFKLGAFGGVLFKSLAAGAACCTHLDEQLLLTRYAEVPPVMNVSTTEEIVERFGAALEDRTILEDLGRRGRRWFETYHSSQEIVEKQMQVFGRILSKASDDDSRERNANTRIGELHHAA